MIWKGQEVLLGGLQAGQGDRVKLGGVRWVKESKETGKMEVSREVVH